jgi:hypothetical protein
MGFYRRSAWLGVLLERKLWVKPAPFLAATFAGCDPRTASTPPHLNRMGRRLSMPEDDNGD